MKITVIGTGYVGLVSGACLADVGNDVLYLDLDASKIRVLEEGGIPIHETGLLEIVRSNIGRHMTDYKVIATKSTVPVGTGDKVRQAMEEIKTIVAKYGLKLGEVMGQPAARKPRVGAKKIAEKPAKKPAAILYRHTENPALTWTGGRGRPPKWIKDWQAAGRSLEEARVANG
jgi:UDP-N-acetyl-D-mannosaminuronate dehydrogenase